MRRILIAIAVVLITPIVAVVVYNVALPPSNAQQLVAYALPPVSITGQGLVFPAWRTPVHAVIVTDDAGGNEFSHQIEGFLTEAAGSSTLVISEDTLANSKVSRGEHLLIICVCRDIIAAATTSLSESLAFQVPNEVERQTMLDQYKARRSKGFLTFRVSAATREVESATVYAMNDPSPELLKATARQVLTALSPQLDYLRRADNMVEDRDGRIEVSSFGKMYFSAILSPRVFPGMARSEFEAAIRETAGN